jgi:hypothetical protein
VQPAELSLITYLFFSDLCERKLLVVRCLNQLTYSYFRQLPCEYLEFRRITLIFDVMPDRMAEDLLMFIRKNGGTLGKRRREGQFAKLTDDEVAAIERIVQEAFEGFRDDGGRTVPET